MCVYACVRAYYIHTTFYAEKYEVLVKKKGKKIFFSKSLRYVIDTFIYLLNIYISHISFKI